MSKANKDNTHSDSDVYINYSKTGDITGFSAGAGTASKSDSKWAGPVGSTAYTVGDIVAALKQMGVLAQ
jgi:hypothetical protein